MTNIDTTNTPNTQPNSPAAQVFTLPDGHHLIAPVVVRPTYAIGYEAWAGQVFMHFRFFDGLSGVDADALGRDVAACSEMLGQPIFATSIPGNAGFNRVLEELGFAAAGTASVTQHGTANVLVRAPRPRECVSREVA